MIDATRRTDRRHFVRNAALAAAGGLLLPRGLSAATPAAEKSRVVLIRDARVFDASGELRAEVVAQMLDSAVTTLVGEKKAPAAWRALFRPSDVVGVKSNVWEFLPTPGVLEKAIETRLLEAGVVRENLAVDDRGILRNAVFQRSTALLNVRPMRTHHWAGVGTLIKNYIMFAPHPPDYHADACADLAAVWSLPIVKDKTRLNVLVLLTPQFHGVGPHSFSPKYVWRYGGLAVSRDPVAVDSVGLRVIEAKRREYFGEERPLSPPSHHIRLADTRHHLGQADPSQIDLVLLGDREGLLLT
jgi:hypothetical protein